MGNEFFVIAVGGEGKRLNKYLNEIGFKKPKIFFEIGGKAIIEHLIDMGLSCGFKKIYLLVSHNKEEIDKFLKDKYYSNKRIVPVYAGEKGKKYGVPFSLAMLKNKLGKSFVYSDGNILYSEDILKRMRFFRLGDNKLLSVVVSKKDLAPTHSLFGICGKKIETVKARIDVKQIVKKDKINFSLYCSLGLILFDSRIFDVVDNFSMTLDLDNVIEKIFEQDKNSVDIVKFRGNWHALHKKIDIDKLS